MGGVMCMLARGQLNSVAITTKVWSKQKTTGKTDWQQLIISAQAGKQTPLDDSTQHGQIINNANKKRDYALKVQAPLSYHDHRSRRKDLPGHASRRPIIITPSPQLILPSVVLVKWENRRAGGKKHTEEGLLGAFMQLLPPFDGTQQGSEICPQLSLLGRSSCWWSWWSFPSLSRSPSLSAPVSLQIPWL